MTRTKAIEHINNLYPLKEGKQIAVDSFTRAVDKFGYACLTTEALVYIANYQLMREGETALIDNEVEN